MTQIDVLADPWMTVRQASGTDHTIDLGTFLSRLGRNEPQVVTAIQAHHQQAWQSFCCQLAALALYKADTSSLEHSPDDWRAMVRALADTPSAWLLVVDDLSKPAFFQPPVPEGSVAKWKESHSPDSLEVLISSKNFDVKTDRFSGSAAAEHWIFALVTLQTMQGFLGRGNYGIARMNGGFSSRPEVALADGLTWSARFRRDVPRLLEARSDLDVFGFDDEGIGLLWTQPWQGGKSESLPLRALDPFFIEICRRVRLQARADGLVARSAPTHAARIDAKALLGNVGDPWTPVKKDSTALTISDSGFNYRLVHSLLFDRKNFERNVALTPCEQDRGSMLVSFRAMARGQGKTGGFHFRHFLMPLEVVDYMRDEIEAVELGEESQRRIDAAAEVGRKVLKFALIALCQERVDRSSSDGFNFKDKRPDPFIDRFDQHVDGVFFTDFFHDIAHVPDAHARQDRWHRTLKALAEKIFHQATASLAPQGIHRHRAISRATSLFYAKARQALPTAFDDHDSSSLELLASSPSTESLEVLNP